jgi:hypothetical protein
MLPCMAWVGRVPGLPSTAAQRNLLLAAQGAAAIRSPTDYEAIARTAPWLTHLSLEPPASATALPQEMAGMLSACSKLEDNACV